MVVGRSDNQVKVRGQRIELEAVDAALEQVGGVSAATTVVLRGDIDTLLALVVATAGAPANDLASAVRADLATRLPGSHVPDEVRVGGELPRTSSGKSDRPASHRLASASSHD